MGEWNQVDVETTVEQLHSFDVPDAPERLVRWCVPTDRAIVLGRAQPDAFVDHDAARRANTTVVRRRSGGGVVLVDARSMFWFDIVVPNGDALWDDDVNRSFHWLGDVIVSALDVRRAHAHKGAMLTGDFARDVCFIGVGPGEVLVDGKKIVGISQRRRRSGAVFQCSVLTQPNAQDVTGLVRVDDDVALDAQLAGRVGHVVDFDGDAFRRRMLSVLGTL